MNKTIAILMAAMIAMVGIPSAMAVNMAVEGEVLIIVGVCADPTIGISANPSTLDFGKLYPGGTNDVNIISSIAKTLEAGCDDKNVDVTLTYTSNEWIPSPVDITTTIDDTNNVYPINMPIGTSLVDLNPASITVNVGSNVLPGVYTSEVTITATF